MAITRREAIIVSGGAAVAASLSGSDALLADSPPRIGGGGGDAGGGQSRADQFKNLRPSFIGFGWGALKDIAQTAFEQGSAEILAKLAAGDVSADVLSGGVVTGVGANWSIRHGHLAVAGPGIRDELSGICPYELALHFEADQLSKVELTLFLLNPRFVIADSTFIPADVAQDQQFVPLSSNPVRCGFLFVSDPDGNIADRFLALKNGLPASALDPPPAGFAQFAEATLVSRIDLKLVFELGQGAKLQQDVLGRVIGVPDAKSPSGVTFTNLALFSPTLANSFSGLLWSGAGLGLKFAKQGSGPKFILNPPKQPSDSATAQEREAWKNYRTAVTEFGLSSDFKGMLFEGIEVHWLNDKKVGHGVEVKLGMSAVSFGSGTAVGRAASWYTAFEASVTISETNTYLAKMSSLSLRAVLAENEPQAVILTGKFNELEFPFAWLSKRNARVALRIQKWKDAAGDEHESNLYDLGIETDGGDVLARFSPQSDIEKAISVALVLAPVVMASGALDVHGKGVPPGADSRAYFADIRPAQSMAELYATAALGYFFKNSVKIRQLRVVGVRLQSQPAVLNKPGATGNDTGLLFDYETDFRIELNDKIKTNRDISVRIDGTGFALTDGLRWVQVPSGVRELALADPGLWELGPLGKVLKIAEVTFRRDPRRELLLKLRLSGNLGIVTAGDFVFVIDLQDGNGIKLQAFPSALTLEIPSTLKGKGILVIDKDGKDVAGSLDLTMLATGLRVFAGARVGKPTDGAGTQATAVMATARVVFPTMIPIASTGLALKGFDGLYASHFERQESPPDPGVPAALKWLKDVKGDVVESITAFPKKWTVAYDHWSFGLGSVLGLVANPKLLNINGMLVVELPGPRLIMFAKANLLKEPKNNQQVQEELDSGVVGLLEFNVPRQEISFAALADLKFGKYISFRGPLELFFSIRKLSSWHLYLGHFDNKIRATLEIGGIFSAGVAAYLMAAGDVIKNAPLPGGQRDLPGFALALGCEASVQIGSGSLFLRVDFKNYLFVSLSDMLYADGGVALSGELRLFIVSIGASGAFDFQYARFKNDDTAIYIQGSICGHAKLVFVELSGCVTLAIGAALADTTKFPALISGVKLVAGVNVALHGQGVLGPIDEVLATATEIGVAVPSPTGIPLDVVIAIGLEAAPRVPDAAQGFAAHVVRPLAKDTAVRIGARQGYYELQAIRLWRIKPGGQREEFDYLSSAATWWSNAQSPAGGQPIPQDLALLTRNPLAANNAVISEQNLKAWIDAVLGGICDAVLGPQACLYLWGINDVGKGKDGAFVLPAVLCGPDIERKIGRNGAASAAFRLDRRPGFGTPNDPLAGLPAVLGGCIAAADPDTGRAVPMITIVHRMAIYPDGNIHPLSSTARLQADILPGDPLDLLLAHRIGNQPNSVTITIKSRLGGTTTIRLGDAARVSLEDLNVPDVQQAYHKDCVNWKGPVEAFARLSKSPEFAGAMFVRARVDLSSFTVDDHPVEVTISFNESLEQRADATLFIGAMKYVPFDELARSKSDEQHRQEMIDALRGYLNAPQIPLLEPNSEYQVEITWRSVGDNEPQQTRQFAFVTTDQPPSSARPYLLTVFPEAGERFHYLDDRPGFALASADLLRILEKFPDARIKVTITEDAGNPVLNPDRSLKWNEGVLVDPHALNDSLHEPPKGFIRDSIASLPSALKRAIEEKMKSGELQCLGNIALPDAGIWIGFDAVLRPISGYGIRLDIVDRAGSPWVFPKGTAAPGDESFLDWRFRTGLYGNLGQLVGELRKPYRHRVLVRVPVLPTNGGDHEQIIGVPDKGFEDAMFEALGERHDKTVDASITVLWSRDGADLTAHGLLLESKEPLRRSTETVSINPVGSGTLAAETSREVFQAPDLAASLGIKLVYVSSSGFSIFAEFGDIANGAKLVFSQLPINCVSRSAHAAATIEMAAPVLATRTAGEE